MRGLALLAPLMILLSSCSKPLQQYQHPDHGFKLSLPTSWTLQENKLGSALLAEPNITSSPIRYISVDVSSAKANTPLLLEDYAAFRMQYLQGFARHSNIHSKQTTNIADLPAQRLHLSVQTGAQHSEMLVYYLIVKRKGYALTGSFAADASEREIRQLDTILTSFHP
ncbi:MAG: hypothetical protein ACSHWQ_03160 [Spongiibacteraceae bacterium]